MSSPGLHSEVQDNQGYTGGKERKCSLDDFLHSLRILSFVDSRDLKMAAQSAPKVVLKSTTKMSLNER